MTITHSQIDDLGRSSARRGSILLLVLVTLMIMSLTTSTYLLRSQNEHLATRHAAQHQQTRRLAESGIEYLKIFLQQTPANIDLDGGVINNAEKMQGVLVVDDPVAAFRGRFTVVAPDLVEGYYSNVRFGLQNESAKINLNTLVAIDDEQQTRAREMLMFVPGMEQEIADAILDWIDDDSKTRDFGAEQIYYQDRDPSYQPRNGPLASLDELLMIRGVTPELLYGLDTNRNFVIDANETPRGALAQLDNSLGQLDRGWSAYLTVHSLEGLVTPDGEKKIALNSSDLTQLHSDLVTALSQEAANFIVAYRQFGPAGQGSSGQTIDATSLDLDLKKTAKSSLDSPLDLIGARVSFKKNDNASAQLVESPWDESPSTYRQKFLELLDLTTVVEGDRIAGRININQASRPVLLAIPGMTTTLADQILTRREPEVDRSRSEQRHAIWLLAEQILNLDQMKQMNAYLTTGGDVYRAQVVGYFDAGTPRARIDVMLDRSDSPTRLVGWEDLSKLGPGFDLELLGTEED